MSEVDEKRRRVFGEIAALYDKTRPGYPEALIDDVLGLSNHHFGGKILEIGSGTGQATSMFAARGCQLLGLEPSAEIARLARKNTQWFDRVEIRTERFEDFAVHKPCFDLIVSAQAFHWILPEPAYSKSADAL